MASLNTRLEFKMENYCTDIMKPKNVKGLSIAIPEKHGEEEGLLLRLARLCDMRSLRKVFAFFLLVFIIPWTTYFALGGTVRSRSWRTSLESLSSLFQTNRLLGIIKESQHPIWVMQVREEENALKGDANGTELSLSYAVLQDGLVKLGREMNVSRALLHNIGLPQTTFMNLTIETALDLMFVTAASENHFKESMVAISRIQHFMPETKILYYDLGLTELQVNQAKTWCNLEYRQFDFSIFPEHVKDLKFYSWKPLIIQEVFREFPTTGIVWMDASFRLQTNDLSIIIEKVTANRGGIFTFNSCSHSVYAATHPQMYEYLPTDIESMKPLNMQGANSMFIYPTRHIYHSFLYWWYVCALDEMCQAPPNITRPCPLVYMKGGERRSVYYEFCHRFDQSAMNILLGNMYMYDKYKYTVQNANKLVRIERQKDMANFTLQTCGGQ